MLAATETTTVTTQPSAPPESICGNPEDPKPGQPEGARQASLPRVETPMPRTLSRLMSHSKMLAREALDP